MFLLNIVPLFSILPGGCVINCPLKSVSLSYHEITVAEGEEFRVNGNFGRGSQPDTWQVINLTPEIELVNYYELETFPPTLVWVFKPHFMGNYTIFFHNKVSNDVISVDVNVI